MLPEVYLWLSLIGALFTLNVYFPQRRFGPLIVPSFFAGWLTGELALHHVAWQLVATLGFAAFGAFAAWQGWVGLVVSVASWIGLLYQIPIHRSAADVVEQALKEARGERYGENLLAEVKERMQAKPIPLRHLLPFRLRHRGVRVTRDIPYVEGGGPRQRLDLYAPKHSVSQAPVLLQIHGGGWVIGNKREQALPLMNHMAARGWICVAINYQLSPKVAFPEHLIDAKRALAWIRREIASYGGDPNFVVVTGGSAGGHLSSLMALTANVREYQPGFEEVDTTLRGCLPIYGVYDFSGEHGQKVSWGIVPFIERVVMKCKLRDDPGAFRRASPIDRIHPDAPPFFVIHGSLDGLAPVEEARYFVRKLRDGAKAPVAYAEIPGAQHAFEIFHSLRTSCVIDGAGRYLASIYSDYVQEH